MPPENTRKTSGLIKWEQMAKDGLRVLKPSLLQCVKSVQIQSFFLVSIFLYSEWIQENTDQKKLCIWSLFTHCLKKCFFFPINISVYIIHSIFLEVVTQRCSMKKGVLTNFTKFTGKHLRQSLFFNYNFIKKETLAKVFSCEFCETSKNTFFTEYLWVTFFFSKTRRFWFVSDLDL